MPQTERHEENMRKSLLSLIIVGALANWAAPALAAEDTQPQHCTAGSAKDVGLNKNQVACRSVTTEDRDDGVMRLTVNRLAQRR
jgi:hypothetical protein